MLCANCVCSLVVYEEHPFAKVHQIVRRSRLAQPLMLHAIAYGLSAVFKTVPGGPEKGMADVICSSQVQSRINEKGNKVMLSRSIPAAGEMTKTGFGATQSRAQQQQDYYSAV